MDIIKKNYNNVSTKISFQDYIESLIALAVCKKLQPDALRDLHNVGFTSQKEKIDKIFSAYKKNNSKENNDKENTSQKKEELNFLKSLRYSQIPEVIGYQLHTLEELYDIKGENDADTCISFSQKIRIILAQINSDFANSTATESAANLFAALIGDCKELTVACPAAGMASIVSRLKAKSYHLREILPHIFALSAALLYLEGKTINFVAENSMLKKPAAKADVVVLSPPMEGRFHLDTTKLRIPLLINDKVPTSGRDSLWVQLALAYLNDTGKAYILLPPGWFFRGGYDAKVRAALLVNDYVDAVIALSPKILQKPSVSPSMLILNKSRKPGAPIHFIDASNYDQPSKIDHAYLSPENCSYIAELMQDTSNNDACCTTESSPELQKNNDDKKSIQSESNSIRCWTAISLSELQKNNGGKKAILTVSHFIKPPIESKKLNVAAELEKMQNAFQELEAAHTKLTEALKLIGECKNIDINL